MNDYRIGSVWALVQRRRGEVSVYSAAVVVGMGDNLKKAEDKVIREFRRHYPDALEIGVGGWSTLSEMTNYE